MPRQRSANPFTTQRIRPGSIEFVFRDGESIDAVLARLAQQDGYGQIVGPHGTGKSTLLSMIQQRLTESGQALHSIRLTSQDRRLSILSLCQLASTTQVTIDGFEQLSTLNRRLVRFVFKWRGIGLLVTTHSDAKLPMVYDTTDSAERCEAVVKRLLPSDSQHQLSAGELQSLVQEQDGNVREVLFALYDWYEQLAPRDSDTPR
jgi:ABC-type lipoprotein export system ATPase subunit